MNNHSLAKVQYFNFCSDVFLFFVFSGTSFVYTKKENIFFKATLQKREKYSVP